VARASDLQRSGIAAGSGSAFPRPWLRRWGLLLGGGCAVLAVMHLRAWHDTHGLFINATDSLPNWALLVEAGTFPRRGDYVLFRPGRNPLVTAHFGSSPPPFAKIAYGVPGDVVTRAGNAVLINGHEVARLKPFSRLGEPLAPGPLGVVPRGCIYAGSPHKDGFDSRYAAIGFVCTDRLLGTGKPIL
jgi:conjugal transfer pilin signal peptidase TrbI